MKGRNPPCPCGSGPKYGACCRPYHLGAEPPDPVALMRSRFSAYALGEAEYLVRTLHPEHADRARPEPELLAELRRARQRLNFTRLRVLDHDLGADGSTGRVLFHAEIYERGVECSFLECSRFARTSEGWRYLSGVTKPLVASTPEIDALTLSSADVT